MNLASQKAERFGSTIVRNIIDIYRWLDPNAYDQYAKQNNCKMKEEIKKARFLLLIGLYFCWNSFTLATIEIKKITAEGGP